MRIWKFPLALVDIQSVEMPAGAKLLDVQLQRDLLCLWALCDEQAPIETRSIAIIGTGNPVPELPMIHIATFQLAGGDLVFHAFEVTA